jgi:hypothetical protein
LVRHAPKATLLGSGLASINDIDGREAVIAMFKVALDH